MKSKTKFILIISFILLISLGGLYFAIQSWMPFMWFFLAPALSGLIFWIIIEKHLLIDLPSVDKENDEGKLLAHKAFWNVKDVNNLNDGARLDCTITEMIFVDDKVKDESYILNLQIASFENDASPSKPILYSVQCLENSVQ